MYVYEEKVGMVAHAYYSSTQKVETEELRSSLTRQRVGGYPEARDSLPYTHVKYKKKENPCKVSVSHYQGFE